MAKAGGFDQSSKNDDFGELLAKELNYLSIKEREHAYFDIHGVSESIDETPSFVAQKLAELDTNISKMKKHRSAYDKAKAQNPDYVFSRNFRLSFLRSEHFEPTQAALRLVKFCQGKLELFGEESLGRNITMKDLDEQDLECLKSGIMQASWRSLASLF